VFVQTPVEEVPRFVAQVSCTSIGGNIAAIFRLLSDGLDFGFCWARHPLEAPDHGGLVSSMRQEIGYGLCERVLRILIDRETLQTGRQKFGRVPGTYKVLMFKHSTFNDLIGKDEVVENLPHSADQTDSTCPRCPRRRYPSKTMDHPTNLGTKDDTAFQRIRRIS
jgi:hypothetical protein